MKGFKKILLVIGLIAISTYAEAQNNLLDVKGYEDCASLLTIETRKTIGPTTAPVGYGKELEFKNNSREDLHFMEQENHSVWYKFETKTNGSLTFEIEPLDTLNDYDFTLYQYTEDNFCEAVKNKSLLPIRTNFSRNKPEIGSKTGLKLKAEEEFVRAGINPAYSKPLPVKPQETYVLVVNNVYDNGAGHLLHFDYSVNLSLEGTVVDIESETSVDATVTLTNTKTGDVLGETISDSITGAYKLTFDIPKSQLNDPLHLEFNKDGYFFEDKIITAYEIATKLRGVKVSGKIQKLKKGARFVVGNILFHGNSAEPLPRSLPTIKALYKTMKLNKTLKISIEGHTNGCSHGSKFSMDLSNARAQTVLDYLVKNKITADRLEAKGFGCQRMLHAMTGSAQHLNRRVEIEIIDM